MRPLLSDTAVDGVADVATAAAGVAAASSCGSWEEAPSIGSSAPARSILKVVTLAGSGSSCAWRVTPASALKSLTSRVEKIGDGWWPGWYQSALAAMKPKATAKAENPPTVRG